MCAYLFVDWLLNVPATGWCISGTDLLRQVLRAATEIEVADQTFCLTQSQYTDTGPTCLSANPIPPGAWQGSNWSANFSVTGMTRPGKIPSQTGFEPRIFSLVCQFLLVSINWAKSTAKSLPLVSVSEGCTSLLYI